MQKQIEFVLNGEKRRIDTKPGEMLAELLRERLGLTGTKIGCNESECGACTVIVNGEPILSCNYPALKIHGKEVLTIEGMAGVTSRLFESYRGEQKLHPLQEAFILFGAVQCGFCTPGQIMTSYALLETNRDPSCEEIREALKDTLCRCGGYPSIEKAVLAAGRAIREKKPVCGPGFTNGENQYKMVGSYQIRPDAKSKVTGDAIFTDDLKFNCMLFGGAKRAMIPHGILTRLEIGDATEIPGVVKILVAEDIPGERNHGVVIPDWPSIVGVGERVRYVGDVVAIVAGESPEIVKNALGLIQAEYELQEIITDPIRAHDPDSPHLHADGNLLKHIKVRKGNVEDGFARSDQILEHTFYTQTTDHAFLEPECSIAVPLEKNRMEIYVGSQIPYADRNQVAKALGWKDDQVRIVGQLMGGGFGGKEDIAGQIHAALLANATHRPVKFLFDRHESLLVHPKRHATRITVKLGANGDGTLQAVKTLLYGDTGAYASLGEKVMARATTHSSGPYSIPNVQADCYAMYTNNPPSGAFRGFGALQGQFAIEVMMDRMAEALGLDPMVFRRKNALQIGSITNTGQVLAESVGLTECIDRVTHEMIKHANRSGYLSPFLPLPVLGSPHIIRSWGVASAYKNTGLGGGAPDKAGAEIELFSDGTLQVRTSSAELGQGLVTVLQIIVAEVFSQSPESIDVLVMDTDLTPDGGPTTASRQTYVSGNAAYYAAVSLKQAILSTMSEVFDCTPEQIRFEEGLIRVGNHMVRLGHIVEYLRHEGRDPVVFYEYRAPETKPLGEGGNMHFAYSFASQAVEVEVNTLTGEIKVLKVIAANDVGKAINPLGLQGQIEGGIMMGIGHALTEHFIVVKGVPYSDRLARYRIPNISHTPEIISIIVENPTSEGPFGAKGVGEIVSIPTIPAIINGIYNAVGVRIDRLPVDQEYIVRVLKEHPRKKLYS